MINLLVQFRLFKSEPPLLEVRQKKSRLTLTPANSSIAPPFASDKGYFGFAQGVARR